MATAKVECFALPLYHLSPNHAGILIGLSNTVANVIPILTPLIAGEIVADKVSQLSKKCIWKNPSKKQ